VGKGASVTRIFVPAAFMMSAINAGSRRGLIGLTMPTASAPQMVKNACGMFGKIIDTTSFSAIPRS
jgi:hypothetical protein